MTPVLDPEVINGLRELNVEGEPDVVAEVLELFVDDTPGRIAAIAAAVTAGDATALARAAHALKGSSGNVGARRMQALCLEIELAAKAGGLGGGAAQVSVLEGEFARLRLEVAGLLAA